VHGGAGVAPVVDERHGPTRPRGRAVPAARP
jgi:hypothetical protein